MSATIFDIRHRNTERSMLKIWGLVVKRLQSYQPSNFENDLKAQGFEPRHTGSLGPGPAGRPFLRPPTLTACNFAAL